MAGCIFVVCILYTENMGKNMKIVTKNVCGGHFENQYDVLK
jgi:hypothetical protein